MSVTDDEALILAQTLVPEYPPEIEAQTSVVSVAPLVSPRSGGEINLLVTGEPVVHGVVGAQFGDLEYDVGKSVRWLDFFVDDLFIMDINTGEQRYWVINWAESFPDSQHSVSGRNFFYDKTQAALWRKEQFEAAAKAFHYEEHDWVLFVDGHEGLSFDNRSLPDDYDAQPFMSWMYREIERAVTRGHTNVFLPFFVYLKYSDLQNITYATEADAGGLQLGIPPVSQGVSVPWYLPAGWMPRLFQVGSLRGAFDWSTLDTPVPTPPAGTPPATDNKVQLISYGYAHWNVQDIPAGQTTVPALDATNDDGYKMRKLLSRIRPIAGIPYSDTWQAPATDPTSFPGPWCVDTTINVDPTLAGTVEEKGHTAPAASTAGLRIPLYDTVMRLNLRDGLWYDFGESGNVPLSWDEGNQVWKPNYTPEEWAALGTDATDAPPPKPSNMALRLNGTAGSYTRTQDSPYLDYQYAFTLMAVVAVDDWTPAARQILVSKWGVAGQRSYYWALDPDGLVLVVSRDGTNSIEHKTVVNLNLANGAPAAIGVSFTSDITTFQDEVRFWLYDPQTLWNTIGEIKIVANPTYLPIHNSTTELQIGAHSGSTGNVPGLFRLVSIRQGIGEDNAFGGTEMALMRGDLTGNPTYDRYGNVWSNQGTWSYQPMTNPPLL